MGVLNTVKKYIVKGAGKAADALATMGGLSPSQIEEVEKKRQRYLAEKPDMESEEVQELIRKSLGAVGIEVYQAYLEQIKNIYKPVNNFVYNLDECNRIRFFEITKWVTDSEEKNLDKLVNVYQVLSKENCNIALIYNRSKEKCTVTLGVVNTDMDQPDPAIVSTYYSRVLGAIKGNFPGVELKQDDDNKSDFGIGVPENFRNFITDDKTKSVAIVSNVASEKSENFISQSIEKILDGIVPTEENEEYTIVLLATPIKDQLEIKNRLFELHTALAPYSSWQTNFTYTTSDAENSSASFGVNLGVGAGVNAGISVNDSTSHQELYKENDKDGKFKKAVKSVVGRLSHATGQHNPNQISESESVSSGGYAGANFGVSFSRASSITVQVGKNEGLTQNYANYGIKHTLDIIEKKIKRLDESAALGMWDFAAYVVSDSPVITNNVAHMYMALTQGEESHMTNATINIWDGEDDEDAKIILSNIQRLQHPMFGLREGIEDEWLLYPALVTASTELSGKELAKALNFPRKSVAGLPVMESVSFGRDVQKYTTDEDTEKGNNNIIIGNIYHMKQKENTEVCLDVDSLTAHTFVTGSTGTGKSNVSYQLIKKLCTCGKKVLIIEPAKGEYKNVFGDCFKVYGTNLSKTDLLRTNPFSFPDQIHVLEHIDRLIEIFNACWPMYAAMPAILKDAIEKSYEKVGWNLNLSSCQPKIYPTFYDLMTTLAEVMESSLYSSDTKSDYSGALITRVKSLTNGINGQIFCSGRELSDEELFDNNVIIDLSRVGSNETKSLLMGILVMKLQEYKISCDRMSEMLQHVTVIEEAHNLLRKTSINQSQESSNLQGKSVEMISNSIAEMRAYGEGFIIIDQAPELLDESVIRNTNTKIVLRLPDEIDRKKVGTSMALKDEQIIELAKLPRGVAAVYQNDWIEAVLCKFDKYTEKKQLQYQPKDESSTYTEFFKLVFNLTERNELSEEDVDIVKEWIRQQSEPEKTLFFKALNGDKLSNEEMESIAYNSFDGKRVAEIIALSETIEKGVKYADEKIKNVSYTTDDAVIETIRNLIMNVVAKVNRNSELYKKYTIFIEGGKTIK